MSYLQEYDTFIDENSTAKELSEENNDLEDLREDFFGSFEIWASSIAEQCKIEIQTNEGDIDNAQYTSEIVPLIIKAMKLYLCWSGIMRKTFGFGEVSASSARIESNFNQLKNRVFKSDNLPLRIDTFLDKIISYYKGDHLLIQNNIPLKKIYGTNAIPSNQSSDSDSLNQNLNTEYKRVDEIHIDIVTLDKYSNTRVECNTETNAEEQWKNKEKSQHLKIVYQKNLTLIHRKDLKTLMSTKKY